MPLKTNNHKSSTLTNVLIISAFSYNNIFNIYKINLLYTINSLFLF